MMWDGKAIDAMTREELIEALKQAVSLMRRMLAIKPGGIRDLVEKARKE